MAEVVFFIAGLGAILGAGATISLRNPFFAVLGLVAHLLCLAALFLLLRAEFVAAAQVVVYVGAVMVLYVFVAAYVGGADEDAVAPTPGPGLRALSLLFAGVLMVELFVAVLGTGLGALDEQGAGFNERFGTPGTIGELLLTKFLLPFEVASYLLLVAAVGAVILARRREGLEPAGTISVADLFSTTERTGTLGEGEQGTMIEAGGQPKS
jgi:NADH:ubiquinone oxidoreductase subunit 6 (subunit J)